MNIPKTLLWIIFAAVVVRLVVFGLTLENKGPDVLVRSDAVLYMELAENIAEGQGFVSLKDGEFAPEIFRPPGLPLLIAPFTLLDRGVVVYGAVLLLFAGVLLPLLTYRIGRYAFGHRAALCGAFLIAFEPRLLFTSFLPTTEMPFILFSLGGFYLLMKSIEGQKFSFATLLGGVLLGYSMLIRPPFLYVILTAMLCVVAWALFRKHKKMVLQIGLGFIGVILVITPWMVRNHDVTSSAALSGMGWRNVYTDYLASVRALDNKTSFSSEKAGLKEEALAQGIDYDNPAFSDELRDITLPELWERKWTMVKLETYLVVSFFMHDGYFYTFNQYGFVPGLRGESHSVTFQILTEGVEGIQFAFNELKRQHFIPLFGRGFTIGITILALIGLWIERKNPRAYLFALLIGLTALVSTANGLGVNARLRLPVAPYLFMLAGVTIACLPRFYTLYKMRSRS